MFREEAEGETVPGDQVAQGSTFIERTWQGREEEEKCHNGTLLCTISLNLTNSAGARGKETRVRGVQVPGLERSRLSRVRGPSEAVENENARTGLRGLDS